MWLATNDVMCSPCCDLCEPLNERSTSLFLCLTFVERLYHSILSNFFLLSFLFVMFTWAVYVVRNETGLLLVFKACLSWSSSPTCCTFLYHTVYDEFNRPGEPVLQPVPLPIIRILYLPSQFCFFQRNFNDETQKPISHYINVYLFICISAFENTKLNMCSRLTGINCLV